MRNGFIAGGYMDKTTKKRQSDFRERIKKEGKEIARFPLEIEHLEKAIELFGSSKQKALHDALVKGLAEKEAEQQQLVLLDIEREQFANELARFRKLAETQINQLANIARLVIETKEEIEKTCNSPRIKQTNPAHVPTLKKLHQFILKLENILDSEKMERALNANKQNDL